MLDTCYYNHIFYFKSHISMLLILIEVNSLFHEVLMYYGTYQYTKLR